MKSLLSVCTPFVTEENALSKEEDNVLAYIAGYVVRKMRGKVCQTCLDACVSDTAESEHLDFLKVKKYEGAKDGLIFPSDLLVSVFLGVEKKYRDIIDEAMYSDSVKGSLVTTLGKLDVVQDVHCETCKVKELILHTFVNVRLHHTIRQANRDLLVNKSRKNRKLLKFSHL